MSDRMRLYLLDVLASGDGQEWPDLYENGDQQQIAETMYGAQADALLGSSWLASRGLEAYERGYEKGRTDLARYLVRVADEARARARAAVSS